MNSSLDVEKMWRTSYLLPPPGGEAVRQCLTEIKRLTKRAPVQGYKPGIPWAMHLRAYREYCKRYGEQGALIDPEGRNCRGGFSTQELDIFIPGWQDELV